jgi:hypothetical protein
MLARMGLGVPYHEAKARYMADETVDGAETAFAIGSTVENYDKTRAAGGRLAS